MTAKAGIHRKDIPAEPSDVLLRQFVGYMMKRAYIRIQEDLTATLAPLGLRTGTFSALAVVMASPGISQTQLSQVLDIRRSGVVTLVDELERAGVLRRAPVRGDRRTYSLEVTPAGKDLWQKAERAVRDHEATLCTELPAEDLERLHDLLARTERSAARHGRETEN